MRSRYYYIRKVLLFSTALVFLWGGASSPAQARYAESDTLFIQENASLIVDLSDSLIAASTSQYQFYDHILRILSVRKEALDVLGSRMPITSFNAIETQDNYDGIVMMKIGECLKASRTLPLPPISDLDRETFSSEIGVVPDLGFAPAPYLVMAAIGAISTATESIRASSGISPEAVSSMSLEMFIHAYHQLTTDKTDDITATRTESLRQDSVVERLRCQKDGSNYRVRQIKNKLFADETFATLYFLRCNICYQDRQIWFPHIYLEKLMKAEKQQNLKNPPKRVKKSGDLEP